MEYKEAYAKMSNRRDELETEVRRLRKAMFALFAMSLDDGLDAFIDILTDALLGEDLFRTYEEFVLKGEQSLKEIMES